MKEYIEREALLKDIEEMLNTAQQHVNITGRGFGKTLWTGIYKGINFCKTKLLVAPAADVVEVRHGRWITEDCDLLFAKRAECSVCGKGLTTTDIFDYCPNCGAKMDKGE